MSAFSPEDREEQGTQAEVDGSEQDQHDTEASVDVPVRRRPGILAGQRSVNLVGQRVAVEIGLLVSQRDDHHRSSGQRHGLGLATPLRPAGRLPEQAPLAGSVSTTNAKPWLYPADGMRVALTMSCFDECRETGSSEKSRTIRRRSTTSLELHVSDRSGDTVPSLSGASRAVLEPDVPFLCRTACGEPRTRRRGLDSDTSAEMSLRYAHLFDSTIRTEYERALTLAKCHIGNMPTPTGPTLIPVTAAATNGAATRGVTPRPSRPVSPAATATPPRRKACSRPSVSTGPTATAGTRSTESNQESGVGIEPTTS